MMPAHSKEVRFVASDPKRGGLPVKRKQVQHACQPCRRKKRRCVHADDYEEPTPVVTPSEGPPSQDSASQTSPSSTGLNPASRTRLPGIETISGGAHRRSSSSAVRYGEQQQPPPSPQPVNLPGNPPSLNASKPQSSRFVGDLNPEGMFVEATGSASARATSQKGDVGIWLSSAVPGSGSAQGGGSQFITSRPPQMMDQFLLPFVKQHCLSCLPPAREYRKLKQAFLNKVHPIFPVIPEPAIESTSDSPNDVVMRQLVCLAAAPDPDMAPYLVLKDRGSTPLSCQDFMGAVSSAIRAVLETSIIPDRVVHIRALVMLSLYTQPSCAEEADLPAQLGGRAVHHIQTLGLHLLRYETANGADFETLFCAVWAVDRINAAFYGRPCLMHERDIGANLDGCIKNRPPCFRLLLSVCQYLDQVIELYRPGPSAEASGIEKVSYIDLPVLEAMIVEAGALRVATPLIATIETFYHAVIILSCRLPRPGTRTAASTLPPASANARRSLAAERIAHAVPRDNLSPVPFVPYAVSLALSVEYRKMRHSRLPMFRSRAMHAFNRNCEMLRKYGEYFWSASVVAGLGERVLKEMERAANTLTRDLTPPPPETPGSGPSSQTTPRTTGPPVTESSTLSSNVGVDAVDFTLVDAISGRDVFGHIDPNFDLNAVEDALEANLDIGLPFNWGDWGQFTV